MLDPWRIRLSAAAWWAAETSVQVSRVVGHGSSKIMAQFGVLRLQSLQVSALTVVARLPVFSIGLSHCGFRFDLLIKPPHRQAAIGLVGQNHAAVEDLSPHTALSRVQFALQAFDLLVVGLRLRRGEVVSVICAGDRVESLNGVHCCLLGLRVNSHG
jgi:hypothetical protein